MGKLDWISIAFRISRLLEAGIAQLVEHDLAKVGVASSSLVSRSNPTVGKIREIAPRLRQVAAMRRHIASRSVERPPAVGGSRVENRRSSDFARRRVIGSKQGWVAEWPCSGLQLRVRRFDSDPSLQFPIHPPPLPGKQSALCLPHVRAHCAVDYLA